MKKFAIVCKIIEEGQADLIGAFQSLEYQDAETYEDAVKLIDEGAARIGFKVITARLIEELPAGEISDDDYHRILQEVSY